MKCTLNKVVFGGILSVAFLSATAGATSIGAGQFNLSGNLYVTAGSVLFGYATVPPPGDQTAGIQLPDTGPFSTLAPPQTATIHNITSSPAFPSGNISIPQWILLPDGIDLDLQNVPFNLTIAPCTGTAADNVIGNSCRPNSTSPIILTQTATGVTAKLNVMGVAYTGTSTTGSSPFNGLFSANFTPSNENTISGLLGTFAAQGFIDTSYSANFSTPGTSAVPEPATLTGLGLGILAFGAFRRKNKSTSAV